MCRSNCKNSSYARKKELEGGWYKCCHRKIRPEGIHRRSTIGSLVVQYCRSFDIVASKILIVYLRRWMYSLVSTCRFMHCAWLWLCREMRHDVTSRFYFLLVVPLHNNSMPSDVSIIDYQQSIDIYTDNRSLFFFSSPSSSFSSSSRSDRIAKSIVWLHRHWSFLRNVTFISVRWCLPCDSEFRLGVNRNIASCYIQYIQYTGNFCTLYYTCYIKHFEISLAL